MSKVSVSDLSYFVANTIRSQFADKKYFQLYILVIQVLLCFFIVETSSLPKYVGFWAVGLYLLAIYSFNRKEIQANWQAFKINQANKDMFEPVEFDVFVPPQNIMVRNALLYILAEYDQDVLQKLEELPMATSKIYVPLHGMSSNDVSKAYGSVIRQITTDRIQEQEVSDIFTSYSDFVSLTKISADAIRDIDSYNKGHYQTLLKQCFAFFQAMIDAHQTKDLILSLNTLTPKQYAIAQGFVAFAQNHDVRIAQLKIHSR